MSLRVHSAVSVLALAAVMAAATATLAGQKWTPARTADGHPDFQGVWANNTVTPLQRPKQWEGKTRLTDAEIAELQDFARQITENDGDAQFGDGFINAVLNRISKPGSYDPGPATTTSSGWSSATGTTGARRSSAIRRMAGCRR